jgi:AraC-like DNA-binding protein
VSALTISAQLGIGRRTLHRRLRSAGMQFQEVLNQTRCEYTQQLLAHTRLKIASIATIAGYTDQSVLTRGFVRWTGLTPSQWRTKRLSNTGSAIGYGFHPD